MHPLSSPPRSCSQEPPRFHIITYTLIHPTFIGSRSLFTSPDAVLHRGFKNGRTRHAPVHLHQQPRRPAVGVAPLPSHLRRLFPRTLSFAGPPLPYSSSTRPRPRRRTQALLGSPARWVDCPPTDRRDSGELRHLPSTTSSPRCRCGGRCLASLASLSVPYSSANSPFLSPPLSAEIAILSTPRTPDERERYSSQDGCAASLGWIDGPPASEDAPVSLPDQPVALLSRPTTFALSMGMPTTPPPASPPPPTPLRRDRSATALWIWEFWLWCEVGPASPRFLVRPLRSSASRRSTVVPTPARHPTPPGIYTRRRGIRRPHGTLYRSPTRPPTPAWHLITTPIVDLRPHGTLYPVPDPRPKSIRDPLRPVFCCLSKGWAPRQRLAPSVGIYCQLLVLFVRISAPKYCLGQCNNPSSKEPVLTALDVVIYTTVADVAKTRTPPL
ncbi:hypothetical protein C8F04DRAFT_1402237 [Mycena alexandri]|uniref:Uncharacterized protein n=1 Tax=Mycena alexandri TaxID=1745969 RepID=A0AAD6S9A7_9AGAR|nr:hypothetical protein C8F04DRAFT_1402237 [Mycena alexandri]